MPPAELRESALGKADHRNGRRDMQWREGGRGFECRRTWSSISNAAEAWGHHERCDARWHPVPANARRQEVFRGGRSLHVGSEWIVSRIPMHSGPNLGVKLAFLPPIDSASPESTFGWVKKSDFVQSEFKRGRTAIQRKDIQPGSVYDILQPSPRSSAETWCLQIPAPVADLWQVFAVLADIEFVTPIAVQ